MTTTNISVLKEQFKNDCEIIKLKMEYPGYTGKEEYAIVSALDEDELWQKYESYINKYVPFVFLPARHGEAIKEYDRNEDKHKKRMCRSQDIYGYDDSISSQFHSELWSYDEMEYERKEREEKEQDKEMQLALIRKGLDSLTESQRRRVVAVYFDKKTLRQVADEEGVSFTKIDKSVKQSLKKLKKFLKTGGTKPTLCPNE